MNAQTRQQVWERAHSVCEYCKLPARLSEFGFEIDHILAEKHGGDPRTAREIPVQRVFSPLQA